MKPKLVRAASFVPIVYLLFFFLGLTLLRGPLLNVLAHDGPQWSLLVIVHGIVGFLTLAVMIMLSVDIVKNTALGTVVKALWLIAMWLAAPIAAPFYAVRYLR